MTTTTDDALAVTIPAANPLWDWFFTRYQTGDLAGSGQMRHFGDADDQATALWALREGFRLLVVQYKRGWRPSDAHHAATTLEGLIPSGFYRQQERFIRLIESIFSTHHATIINLIDSIEVETAGTGTTEAVLPSRDWSDPRSESRGYAVNIETGLVVGYNSHNREALTIRTRDGDVPTSAYMPIWTDDRIEMIADCRDGSGFRTGEIIRFLRWGDINLMYVEALADDDSTDTKYVRTTTVKWSGPAVQAADVPDLVIDVDGVQYVRKDVLDDDVATLSRTLIRASRRENLCGVYDATINVANRRTTYLKIDPRRKDRLVTVRETYEVTRVIRVDGLETDDEAREAARSNMTRLPVPIETNQRIVSTSAFNRTSQEVIAVDNA